ncbi:MAG: orotidine 5-phosphate decarboxylase [Peptococcaceae bacterium]|jgi:orotidine-5'-phosphate decarboxylase|nr:orotidine 5-phosphate decarboxylase [Peptococcaceae bacterium]
MKNTDKRLIVALDFPTWGEAEKLVNQVPEVMFYKVGLELYLASRGEAVVKLREMGKEVFLDLKFHDIPNTVAQASRQAVAQGATIFDVHAAGGREMMKKAAQAAQEQAEFLQVKKPLLLAITVLTSMDEKDLKDLGLPDLRRTVESWAKLSQEAGLDGVVASPHEISIIRETCGPNFKILCPGVRPSWAEAGDQKRILTPHQAVKLGADYIVVGRPITQSRDPRSAALRVIEELSNVF